MARIDALTKRILAALLFILGGRLDRAGKWCQRTSMRMMGFNIMSPPPPPPMELAGGCLDCGSLFAVKAEFDAHKCPKGKTSTAE